VTSLAAGIRPDSVIADLHGTPADSAPDVLAGFRTALAAVTARVATVDELREVPGV